MIDWLIIVTQKEVVRKDNPQPKTMALIAVKYLVND